MAPLTLEGDTLGKKHQYFNKLVGDSISNKSYTLTKINEDDSDIENLLKIDIACKTQNVDYIMEVLKSDDMLYVSSAIKSSTWLITNQKYAHIINPEYLHTQLFPQMSTKAVNKLMLTIRLKLKDEKRIDDFYTYLKDTKDADKWLENCSISAIEDALKSKEKIPYNLFKRLCKRSTTFLTYFKKVEEMQWSYNTKDILFLLKSNTDEVLNILEEENYYMTGLRKKHTKIIMKHCPDRIFNKFDLYIGNVDLSVVVNYLKREEIKPFLFKQMKNERVRKYMKNYNNLKYFIMRMPENERFDFVKQNFIEKSVATPSEDEVMLSPMDDFAPIPCSKDSYHWYKFAPFNVAFTELKKIIRAENSPSERSSMLTVLVSCAKRNPVNIKIVLKHYCERHINEPFKFKVQFVNSVLSQVNLCNIDVETWTILDKLFHSMEVYTEVENNVQLCLKSIILYKILNDTNVPEIVEKKLKFETFADYQRSNKLNEEKKNTLFKYLLQTYTKNIITLNELQNVLNLLKDWKKNINDYPFILDHVRNLIKNKVDTPEIKEFSSLYNVHKSLRRHMFEESLILNLSEEACINALKHEPELLKRHDKQVAKLRANDAVMLRRFLTKLRVFWPHTYAQWWIDASLHDLNKPMGQKALISGLFTLLKQKEVIKIAEEHVPKELKINWGTTDQAEISLQKNIARQLHEARPPIPLDIILKYAKGDYLQYAVPSLNATLHNMSKLKSREYLPKLLDAPVSLQKFGLHLAFEILKSEELNPLFSEIWKTTKNSTIRSVLFIHTFDTLCKVKNITAEKELWELLTVFINNLSSEENKTIYKKLSDVKNVPDSIRIDFFVTSYEFLTALPEKANCENYVKKLQKYAPSIMELLNEDFVAKRLLSPIQNKFCDFGTEMTESFACYALCGKSEEEQLLRFRKVIIPAIDYAIKSWNEVKECEYYVRNNLNEFFKSIIWNFRKLVTLGKIPIPSKLFSEIKTTLQEKLPVHENYVLLTSWKLTAEYVKLFIEHKSIMVSDFEKDNMTKHDIGNWMTEEIENVWRGLHSNISRKFGPVIVNELKADIEKYFPTITQLFSDALTTMFNDLNFLDHGFLLHTLEQMLTDDYIPSHVVVCNTIPKYVNDKQKEIQRAIRIKIKSHPSKEVQMHYYKHFGNNVDTEDS